MPLPRALVADWPLKLTSLFLSLLLWLVAAGEEPASALLRVGVSVRPPPGRSLIRGPQSLQALVVGPRRELIKLSAAPLQLTRILPDTLTGDLARLELVPSEIEIPRGVSVRVQDLRPRSVTVELDPTFQRVVPVHPLIRGLPDSGLYVLGAVSLVPGVVRLLGPQERVRRIDSVQTLPLELAPKEGQAEHQLSIDTVGLGPVRVHPRQVTLRVSIQSAADLTLRGVTIRLPSVVAQALRPDHETVSVLLRGPAGRLARLTAESVLVVVDWDGTPRPSRVALRVLTPHGVTGRAEPDSIGLVRRDGRG